MRLRDFLFAKGKVSQAAESIRELPAPVRQEELTLDLGVLLGFQERAVREDIQEKKDESRPRALREMPFSDYIKLLVQESLRINKLAYDVKVRGNLVYLETKREQMTFISPEIFKHLLELDEGAPATLKFDLFSKPLELLYFESRNYLVVVKSIHSWGIRTRSSEGHRNFSWDRIEGVNYGLLLRKLPFDSTYKLLETPRGFAMRWSLERY